jgi:hypothetical protein
MAATADILATKRFQDVNSTKNNSSSNGRTPATVEMLASAESQAIWPVRRSQIKMLSVYKIK